MVELLRRSGHLSSEEGKLVVSAPTPRPLVHELPMPEKIDPAPSQLASEFANTSSPFTISIRIDLHCEPKDLDDLGSRLRKVVDEFSKKDEIFDDGEE